MPAPRTPTPAGAVQPAIAPVAQPGRVPQPSREGLGLSTDGLLAMMAAQALSDQGYTGEQAAAYAAMGMRVADPPARAEMVTAAAGWHGEERSAITAAADRTAAK